MTDEPWGRRQTLLLAALFEGGLGLLAFPLGWLFGQQPLETWHWGARDAALGAAAAVPMVLVGVLLSWWPVGPLQRIKAFVDELVRPFFERCTPLDLAVISLLAGVGEELLMRGVVQGALGRHLGPVPGLALASVLFGLLHPITLTYFLLASLAGAYLGAVWLWTGNLLVVVVAHALYDFLMLLYLLRSR